MHTKIKNDQKVPLDIKVTLYKLTGEHFGQ